MQSQTQASNNFPIKQYIAKRSCRNCGHLHICALFKAVAPLIASWSQQTNMQPPIVTEDLAIICNQFLSKEITQTLSQVNNNG